MHKDYINSYNNMLYEIRERIKDLRPYGISQTSLAKELNVSREHFNRMVNGVQDLRGPQYHYLIHRLGIKSRN